MKPLALLTAIAGITAITAMGVFLSVLPASAQNTYIMTCKPGGSLYNYTRSGSNGRITTTVHFTGGSQGAAVKAPNPGECTWIDRGLRGGEPTKLIISNEVGKIQASCNTKGCNTNTTAPIGSKLMQAITNNRTFQVHVYNNRNGYMQITKFGP